MDTQSQETCSKCGGDGQQYTCIAHTFFKNWRKTLGLSQSQVVTAVGIADNSQLSKFENGHEPFSEGRMRELADYYGQVEAQLQDQASRRDP